MKSCLLGELNQVSDLMRLYARIYPVACNKSLNFISSQHNIFSFASFQHSLNALLVLSSFLQLSTSLIYFQKHQYNVVNYIACCLYFLSIQFASHLSYVCCYLFLNELLLFSSLDRYVGVMMNVVAIK